MPIRPCFHDRDGMGVSKAAKRTRAIRVAEFHPAAFGYCQGGPGALGDHLALMLGHGCQDVNG